MGSKNPPSPIRAVEKRIFLLRGHRVMLDRDLAVLYSVKPIRLREQVKRNRDRFPRDFMFALTREEADALVSQNAIPSWKHLGGFLPYVFTQEGIAMLSGVLRTKRAVRVNIAIMRAFVRLREMVAAHSELRAKLQELEMRIEKHDEGIRSLFDAISELLDRPEEPRIRIGFKPKSLSEF